MMGLRKNDVTESPTGTPDKSESNFPNENRVFVCQGKLKNNRGPYVWVMTIMDNYDGIVFWEPKTGKKYELHSRVDDPMKLKNFLDGRFRDYEDCKKNILNRVDKVIDEQDEIIEEEDEKKTKKRDFDDKKIPGTGDDDSFINYQQEDFKDDVLNDEEIFNNNFEKIAGNGGKEDKKNNYSKKMGFYDDFVYSKNFDGGNYKNYNYDFNSEQKEKIDKKMRSDGEQYLLPVDDFKDSTEKSLENVYLPFETLDLIFNRKNIWANTQFHDPSHIKYNIYEKSLIVKLGIVGIHI